MGCSKLGISYAVVTKVKELTEARRYGEALDLLEGEDIFQSFNPQFLRCCGEIYMENHRFYESREALVRAHIMAPEGNRIIYNLVHLYLKMGYFQRAKRYYEIYAHNAVADDAGVWCLQYMIQKAQRVDASELLGILEKACEEQYMDDWGFELALLYASLGMKEKMKEECVHLIASHRNSPYVALAEALKKEEYDISNSNFRFPIMEAEEDVETYASILVLEEKQLEKDELKVNPPAPVILQMEDDEQEETPQEVKEKPKGFKFAFGKKNKQADALNTENAEEVAKVDAGDGQEAVAVEEAEPTPEEIVSMALTEDATETVSSESVTIEAVDTTVTEQMETDETASELLKATEALNAESEVNVSVATENQVNPDEENVSAYIESVMKSVADIEASIAKDLQEPIVFQTERSDLVNKQTSTLTGDETEEKQYQPKIFNIEESLSPKERLEQLMRMIEEDRQSEQPKQQESVPVEEEELDMDEFLMNLVGANTITQAMVKNYREEKESKDS